MFRCTAATIPVLAMTHRHSQKLIIRMMSRFPGRRNCQIGKLVFALRFARFLHGCVFVYFRYSQHKNNRDLNSDDNNNNTNRKMRPIRPSNSSGNLVDNRNLLLDDQDVTRDRKGLVKRTKSFWKFGKNSSDSEILEGMALWRHRDLVDVDEKKLQINERRFDSQQRVRKPSRDKSEDSDKTLNAKQYEEEKKEAEPQHQSREKTKPVQVPRRRKMSVSEKLPPRSAEVDEDDEDDFENHFDKAQHIDDQFYDDGDDGLILRTVNRKTILQQYSNDSTGPDSESESEIISDDPYCIVVDDQQKVKRREHITNVAAIGKKLERLSKSTKYDPNQASNNNNKIYNSLEKNNLKNEKKNNETEMHYREKQHSFKTFGREIQNNENGEKETSDNDRYYSSSHNKRSHNESNTLEKRRYYADSGEHNNLVSDRRGVARSSYETIDSNHHHRESEKTDKMKYYHQRRGEIISDELSDVIESKQFLPRTKLTKTNSNNSKSNDNDLMDYGETLQRRIKSPDHGAVFNEKNPNSGNMYGPWYDLWGLDASVRK